MTCVHSYYAYVTRIVAVHTYLCRVDTWYIFLKTRTLTWTLVKRALLLLREVGRYDRMTAVVAGAAAAAATKEGAAEGAGRWRWRLASCCLESRKRTRSTRVRTLSVVPQFLLDSHGGTR